ncbi:MAG: histone deacetylase [Desulfobacteraceae bacterium]|nr:MAG: histone deacetylase [Desulfobacteraceae bacterium]
MKTGIVRDPIYLEHLRGFPHVESPRRLEVLYDMLDRNFAGRLYPVSSRPAAPEELTAVHTPEHIRRVAATAGRVHDSLDPDTQTTAQSYEAALHAAGGVSALIDAVLDGEIENGFALVRPPGHHAEARRAMGFCLFNNVAIGAAYARRRRGLERILIIDWDLHHGNGTQHSFWHSPEVLYFSTHQYPYYPGSGALDEVGGKEAPGFTVNVPLSSGCLDEDFAQIFERILVPIGRQFKPELILVSAGFDTYYEDPLGAMMVTPKGFARLTRIVQDLAQAICRGRLVLALEGGYHLNGLSQSVLAVLRELQGDSVLTTEETRADPRADLAIVRQVWTVQQPYWKRG